MEIETILESSLSQSFIKLRNNKNQSMALINCPECANEVSTKAESCPKCGNPLPLELRKKLFDQKKKQENEKEKEVLKKNNNIGCLSMVVFIFIALIIAGLSSILIDRCSENETKSRNTQTYSTHPTVTVTTIADGYDVKRVNLFSCTSCDNRQIIDHCTNGEQAKLISTSGEYVKLRKSNGSEGWCLKGWIKY